VSAAARDGGGSRAEGDGLRYALYAVAWLGLALAGRQWLHLAPLALAVGLHPLLGRRLAFRPGIVGWVALAVPVALLYQFLPIRGVGGSEFNNSFYFGLLLLLLGAAKLYTPPDALRQPFLLFTTAVPVAGTGLGLPSWLEGNEVWLEAFPLGELLPPPRATYAGLVAVYALLLVASARRGLRRRPEEPGAGARAAAVAVSAALAAGAAWGLIALVDAIYHDVSQAYLELTGPTELSTSAGFSDAAQLGSVGELKSEAGRTIALRAYADRPPGYLRGQTFAVYARGTWRPERHGRYRRPVSGDRVVFDGRAAPGPEAEPGVEVYPTSDHEGSFFLPLGAAAVETECDSVRVYRGHNLRSDSQPTTRGYAVFASPAPVRDDADAATLLRVPDDPELRAALDRVLARTGLGPDVPAEDAVALLARDFAERYDYHFGIELERGRDPVAQFLAEADHGHCELFAASGALLLRRLGIPARYVTGFLCEERNPYGEFYVARNQHAHAWVEYYDPERGWRIAEMTPASGVPAIEPAGGAGAFFEYLGAAWERFKGIFREGITEVPGLLLSALRDAALWLAGAWWRLGLLVLLVVGYLLRGVVRPRGRAGEAGAPLGGHLSPELAAERERYLELEAALAAAGLPRAKGETLLEYAERLAAAEAYPPGRDPAADLPRIRGFAGRRYAAGREVTT